MFFYYLVKVKICVLLFNLIAVGELGTGKILASIPNSKHVHPLFYQPLLHPQR